MLRQRISVQTGKRMSPLSSLLLFLPQQHRCFTSGRLTRRTLLRRCGRGRSAWRGWRPMADVLDVRLLRWLKFMRADTFLLCQVFSRASVTVPTFGKAFITLTVRNYLVYEQNFLLFFVGLRGGGQVRSALAFMNLNSCNPNWRHQKELTRN